MPGRPADAATGAWAPRLAQEARLDALDRLIALAGREGGDAASAEAIDMLVERAALLNALGRADEARTAYLDVLKRFPDHFAALNDFGALLVATGYRTAARTVYAEAVSRHPDNPKGHVNLGNLLLRDSEHIAAGAHFEAALRLDPNHPQAHQGLAAVLAELGDREAAALHRRAGYARNFITVIPYRGTAPPVPMLLLVSAEGGDIPTASFLDDRVFQTFAVVAEFCDPAVALPPHRLVFNAIGDADLCRGALDAAGALIARSAAPAINAPAAVLNTGRVANARRLGTLPGVIAPRMAQLPRAALAGAGAAAMLEREGLGFPLLLRSPGHHTGRHFVKVETAAELAAAASTLPGDELLAIAYLDATGRDGQARKYRVMIIDGELYPLHLAVSRDWKVHYFTADMAENAGHRSEDATFLADMSNALGPTAMAALRRIAGALGLDYAGVDFALAPGGEVLLFEANATMAVHPPEADRRWDYRRPAVARILDAVRTMMIDRAAG